MAFRIIGEHNFSGTMLFTAMQRAHAATKGALTEKQAAGVGVLNRYLETNGARNEAWRNATSLTPAVAVARASLNKGELEAAGRALEAATDVEQRRAILGEVITPFLLSQVTLFGSPVGEGGSKQETIAAGALADFLKANLPGQQLALVANPGHGVISKDQVTNAQYGIFIDQTGHRVPLYWNDPALGNQRPDQPVVGVDYKDDATGFAKWQGRSVPTAPAFLSAEKADILIAANKLREWTSTNNDGQIILALHSSGYVLNGATFRSVNVGFRVAGT